MRKEALGFSGFVLLVSMTVVAYAQEEKKPWVGLRTPQEEQTVKPRSTFDDVNLIVQYMLDVCWRMKTQPTFDGPKGRDAATRSQEPSVDSVLSCIEGLLTEHRIQNFGIDTPDKAEIERARENQ